MEEKRLIECQLMKKEEQKLGDGEAAAKSSTGRCLVQRRIWLDAMLIRLG